MEIQIDPFNLAYDTILHHITVLGNKSGDTKEIINASIELPTNELLTSKKRLMSPYYLCGELMFSLAYSNSLEFISYYSKFWKKITDGNDVRSAYWWQATQGHGFDQVDHVIEQLKKNKNTRQSIIHLHHVNNIPTKDEICTLTIQFMIRYNKLLMIVNMRSNDIILGLPYDHAMFLMLQSYVANELNVQVGKYYHNAGSLHLYDRNKLNITTIEEDQTKYPIVFSKTFFENDVDILIDLEKNIRRYGCFYCNVGTHILNTKLKSQTGKAIATILLMYKRTKEMKEKILNDILKDNLDLINCGLIKLLNDYNNELKNKGE